MEACHVTNVLPYRKGGSDGILPNVEDVGRDRANYDRVTLSMSMIKNTHQALGEHN